MAFSASEQAAAASAVKPALWARLSVNHTKKTCAASCAVPLIALIIVIFSGSLSIDNPSSEDYLIRNDIRTRLDNARLAALDEYRFVDSDSSNSGEIPQRSEEDEELAIDIMFRGKLGSNGPIPTTVDEVEDQARIILSKDTIMLMKDAEDAFMQQADYRRFCWFDEQFRDCEGNAPSCSPPTSILHSPDLYGEYIPDATGAPRFCGRKTGNSLSQEQFNRFMQSLFITANGTKRLNPMYSIFLGKDFTVDNPITWISRSRFLFGRPFEGFNTVDEDVADQKKEYEEWILDAAKDIRELSTATVDVFPIGLGLLDANFGAVVLRDMSFSIVAICLVFIVIWIHTSSAFLAGTAMSQIFLAFPFAFFFYSIVFRQQYFAALQILVIFLILGIGADDVFVFTDAWKQSAVVLGPDCDHVIRMSWTYRRAVRAMAVTSVTTSAAFFVTGLSPLMPISTLGIWAGILILLQFVLVITIYPCATIIWHRFWRVRSFLKCFRKPTEKELNNPPVPLFQRCLPKKWRNKTSSSDTAEYRAVERFFRGPWFSFVRRFRYPLIALAAILAALSIWLATRLEPPVETEQFLPESNELRIGIAVLRDAFPASQSDQQLRVRITWGIKDVDRNGTSRFRPSDLGKAVLDESFSILSKEAQDHLLAACDHFENTTNLIIQSETIQGVQCWIRDFKAWRADQGKDEFKNYESDEEMIEELEQFANAEEGDGSKPFLKYLVNGHIAFNRDLNRIVFTEIRFVSPLLFTEPYSVMWPVYNDWQDELEKVNNDAPESMRKAVATGGYSWMWQISQITLVRSMFTGIGIMLAVAWAALVFSTFNWMGAILATLSIGGIVAMLLGMIYLYGWELGITESIGVVIAVGYSFDGAAHIMTAYSESHQPDRESRTRDALTDLGISILFGALSTLLAGFLLFPAIIIFFVKFAGLVVTTVGLSLLWSLTFLPALLLVIGPEKDFGNLIAMFRKFFKRSDKSANQKTVEISDNVEAAVENGMNTSTHGGVV